MEQVFNCPADFGVRVSESSSQKSKRHRLLKLHGSFGWRDTWPISQGPYRDDTLWIPPGIHKAKQVYPFNVLWGLAREMISCDVLRIIGFSVTANDWDLISLLFTMCHVSSADRPQIEVIDAPKHAEQLKKQYPYLKLLSLLEIETIGKQFVTEFTGWAPRNFDDFSEEEQQHIIESAGTQENWFQLWLNVKVESLYIDKGDVSTDTGLVEEFLNA